MAGRWLLHLASWSPGLLVLAASRHGRRLPAPRGWLLAWATASVGFDAVAYAYAQAAHNNHLILYASSLVLPTLALAALSGWQGPVLRNAYRFAIPLFVAISLAMIAGFERVDTFSRIAGPFEALTVAIGAAGLLIARSLTLDTRSAWGEDWFWASVGFLLRSAASASLPPLAAHFMVTDPSRILAAYEIKAVVDTLATLALAGAVLCPIPVSGHST